MENGVVFERWLLFEAPMFHWTTSMGGKTYTVWNSLKVTNCWSVILECQWSFLTQQVDSLGVFVFMFVLLQILRTPSQRSYRTVFRTKRAESKSWGIKNTPEAANPWSAKAEICFLFLLFGLHPGRLTWNQKKQFKRKIIFQTSMIMFHVNLPGCTPPKKETQSSWSFLTI